MQMLQSASLCTIQHLKCTQYGTKNCSNEQEEVCKKPDYPSLALFCFMLFCPKILVCLVPVSSLG